MQDRYQELEGRILELRDGLVRLRAEAEERIRVLDDSINQLQRKITKRNEDVKYWADKAHNAQRQISEMIYKDDRKTVPKNTELILKRAYEQGWLSGVDFSILIQNLLISESGYVVDTGNWKTVNAEVALRLAEKIKRHPMLWKWFLMVA